MAYKNGNYAAFYVTEPFNESRLGAFATKDFVYYNLLRAWKGADSSFPFIDSHDKNYNVRDDSDWEKTLKPRLHDRLNNSKNIILFLSSITRNSRALREEIEYGMSVKGLPVIVVYPECGNKSDIYSPETGRIRSSIIRMWDIIPVFRDNISKVPTIHIPNIQSVIRNALSNEGFMVNTKTDINQYYYK